MSVKCFHDFEFTDIVHVITSSGLSTNEPTPATYYRLVRCRVCGETGQVDLTGAHLPIMFETTIRVVEEAAE